MMKTLIGDNHNYQDDQYQVSDNDDNYDDQNDNYDEDDNDDDKNLGNSESCCLGHFPFGAEKRMAFQCLVSG